MKRKQPPPEERRRPTAELNLVDEPKRLNVRRRGCGPFFGSLLLLAATLAGLAAALR